MNLKDITVGTFQVIVQDNVLLDLLEVPYTDVNGKKTRLMKSIREQIVEDKYPSDLIEDNLSRLCVYELPSTPTLNPNVEKGWIEIDIYTTKEKNKVDRRVLVVAERLICLLDNENRKKHNLPPVSSGVGLRYYNRLANMQTDSREWVKYGLVFNYDFIRI
ncbi:hypothetical protein [Paenibacillus chitinolyticus]|uniref:hypothetical protein n=1 Tax=Paenibacillus chitinolyticus TaxID=79263 RepID=UPI003D06F8FD